MRGMKTKMRMGVTSEITARRVPPRSAPKRVRKTRNGAFKIERTLLAKFIGGKPSFPLRFVGGVNIPDEHKFVYYPYGNNSSADYFAQTFAILMVDKGKEQEYAGIWVEVLIDFIEGK